MPIELEEEEEEEGWRGWRDPPMLVLSLLGDSRREEVGEWGRKKLKGGKGGSDSLSRSDSCSDSCNDSFSDSGRVQ